MYEGRSVEDVCGKDEKKIKTEGVVDGQCKCGVEGVGRPTVGQLDAIPGCAEASFQIHKPHIDVGKDALEEEEVEEIGEKPDLKAIIYTTIAALYAQICPQKVTISTRAIPIR